MSKESLILSFDIQGIKECQQNKFPVLLIDKIIEVVPGKYAKGFKNFTYNEWFFPGHFENDPNVPGFIQIESLVQTFIMTFLCMDAYKGCETNFIGMNNVRFRRKIIPGERLDILATLASVRHGLAIGQAVGTVDGELACQADFQVSIPDAFNKLRPIRTKG